MVNGLWAGAVAAVIGGGPSLTLDQIRACWEARRTRGLKVLVINDGIRLAPWADMLYFCDGKWFGWHRDDVVKFASRAPVVTLENAKLKAEIPGLVYMRNDGMDGLCLDPKGLRTGKNSGYQALNLCLHLGVKRAILLGYDMHGAEGSKPHWFGEHPAGGSCTRFQDNMLPKFKGLSAPLREAGLEVVNATPGSWLEEFPKMDLAEALTTL